MSDEKYDPLPLLYAKLSTVSGERASGRGDYDDLTKIINDLKEAIAAIKEGE